MNRRLEMMPLGKIKPALKNPKTHAEEEISSSVTRFGYVEAMALDDRTGRLVAGHGRLEALAAMKKAGAAAPAGVKVRGKDWLVPVQRGWKSKNDREAQAYIIASNRTPEIGGWDEKALAKMLGSFESLDGTGFVQTDVDAMLRELNKSTRDVGRTPDEMLAGFQSAMIKQIVLYFESDNYDAVVLRLETIRQQLKAESNTAVMLALLDHWEATHKKAKKK